MPLGIGGVDRSGDRKRDIVRTGTGIPGGFPKPGRPHVVGWSSGRCVSVNTSAVGSKENGLPRHGEAPAAMSQAGLFVPHLTGERGWRGQGEMFDSR